MPIFSSQLGKVESYNPEQSIKTMANHLRKIQEELEYRLMNLDSTNVGEIDLDLTNVLLNGQPIQNVLTDQEGNYSALEQTVNGLASTVANQDGAISTLQQTAAGLQTQVSTLDGRVSTVTQTANGLQTKVSTLEGNYSTLTQTANSLSSQISSLDKSMSSLEQTSDSILGVVYDMQDDVGHMLKLDSSGVYIVDSDGNQVSIHGGQLEAGTVYADYLLGTSVGLLTSAKREAGGLDITGSSSSNYAIELYSNGALRLASYSGAVYIAEDGGAHLSLYGAATMQGEGGAYFEADDQAWVQGHFLPVYKNTYNCGNANYPWAGVWSTNGMCETSDRNKKKDITYGLGKMDGFFDGLRPSEYRMKEGTSGRKHFGFVAQDIKAGLDKHGIPTTDFGGYVEDVDEDGNPVYALRYSEFIALLVDQVQKLKARVAILEEAKA